MPRTNSGKEVNRSEVAEIFGVSVDTISAWVKRGCPFVQEGRKGIEWIFNTASVSKWLVDGARGARPEPGEQLNIDRAYEEARKARYDADRMELKLQIERGEYVPVADAVSDVADEYSTVRAKLGSLPGDLAPKIDPDRSQEIQQVLAEAINDALSGLSADERYDAQARRAAELSRQADEGSEANAQTGSEEDPGRVG